MTRSAHADVLIIAALLLAFTALFGFWWWMGHQDGRRAMMYEAVNHGAAEWVRDPKTGEAAWRWKTPVVWGVEK